jgi:hypothetical protein
MNYINKFPLILLATGFLFLLVATPFYYFKTKQEVLLYEFNGKVENVSYSVKGEPTIKVNGKSYDLPVNFWNFNHQIEMQDSLIKLKNSMIVTIVKKNKEVIVIK